MENNKNDAEKHHPANKHSTEPISTTTTSLLQKKIDFRFLYYGTCVQRLM
jgi:hypothetical protein